MASSDIPSGKRSGYRVIYAMNEEEKVCYLLYIYAKPQQSDISANDIEHLLAELEDYLSD